MEVGPSIWKEVGPSIWREVVRSPESAGFILRPESGGFLSVGLSIRSRTIHMEGSSPEDLSVGPSVINRSRTIRLVSRSEGLTAEAFWSCSVGGAKTQYSFLKEKT